MNDLEENGIVKFWIHWRTETPEIKKKCMKSKIHCITGRCPMIDLSQDFNIHTLHKSICKLLRRY